MRLEFTSVMWAYLSRQNRGVVRVPGRRATYGYVDDSDPEWPDAYYVGLSESFGDTPVGSVDVDYGAFYPERLFVWGYDDSGGDLERNTILDILRALPFKGDAGFWDPCRPWRGYGPEGTTFYKALRSQLNAGGPTWYDLKTRMAREGVPKGWSWDCPEYENFDNRRGTLYVSGI